MPDAGSVLLEYQTKLQALQAEISRAQGKQFSSTALLAASVLVLVLVSLMAYGPRRSAPVWLAPVIVPGVGWPS